jgi:hypothetical protein
MSDTDDFAAHKAELIDRVRNAQVPRDMPNCRGFVDSLGVYAQNLSPEADSPSGQIDHLLERVTAAMLEIINGLALIEERLDRLNPQGGA